MSYPAEPAATVGNPFVKASDVPAAPIWAGIYTRTTDPGIAGTVFNFNSVLTFSTGFVYRRPGEVDGYLRPSNLGTYNRA